MALRDSAEQKRQTRNWRKKYPHRCQEHREKWERNNPEKAARSRRHRNWRAQGINPEQADFALARHKGVCELCGGTKIGGRGNWHVDHDHASGKIRGILCSMCNTALGRLEQIGLSKLATYLRKNGTRRHSSNPRSTTRKGAP